MILPRLAGTLLASQLLFAFSSEVLPWKRSLFVSGGRPPAPLPISENVSTTFTSPCKLLFEGLSKPFNNKNTLLFTFYLLSLFLFHIHHTFIMFVSLKSTGLDPRHHSRPLGFHPHFLHLAQSSFRLLGVPATHRRRLSLQSLLLFRATMPAALLRLPKLHGRPV